MYRALKLAGVSAELHIYSGTAHDFGVRPSGRPCSTWTQSCADWLRQQGFLKPPRGPWRHSVVVSPCGVVEGGPARSAL